MLCSFFLKGRDLLVRLFEKVDQWMNKEDLQADSDARKRLDDATQVTLTHSVLAPPPFSKCCEEVR